jgi:glycosyl transferase, family 25
MTLPSETMLAALGPIVVINLPFRADRLAEFATQLHRIGLSFDHRQVRIFDAVRPDAPDSFPSIGARGCFLSHLGILRQAVAAGQDRLLICEDDLDFTPDALSRLPDLIAHLTTTDWSIFYGGYGETPPGKAIAPGLVQPDPGQGVSCSHFYAIRGTAIPDLMHYLEAMLARPPGDPDGGPMHYDGALGWFRNAHPQHLTLAAVPPLGVQRPSRTDIHALRWFDRLPVVRDAVARLRRTRTGRTSK